MDMLWNLIRDFIVMHITGGFATDGNVYNASLGKFHYYQDGSWADELLNSNDLWFKIHDLPDGMPYYVGLGDWLATTLTAIAIIFILVACVMFVVKMVKLVGNLVK